MCQRATCPTCNKPTYAGCGRHIEQVLGDVPPDQRCKCREEGKDHKGEPSSLIKRILGI